MATFKFIKWAPDATPLKSAEKPVDAIAPKANKDRFMAIKDSSFDLIVRRKKYIEKRIRDAAELTKFNKKATVDMPVVMLIPLGSLEIVLDVQRPLDEGHVIDIMVNWDSRNFGTPKGAYDPIRKKYSITEGHHRVIAFRDKIRMGHFPNINPADWEKVTIQVEVTILEVNAGVTDYSICREQFLGENGGYKMAATEFDKLQNEVSAKLVDSPYIVTKPVYERAAKRYLSLKKEGITCTHTKDAVNRGKAGSFTGVRYLRDKSLTDEEVVKIAKHHKAYWRHEPMSDVEILPIRNLLREIENSPIYNAKDKAMIAEKDKFLLYCNATVHAVAGDWDNFQALAQETWGAMCAKVRQTTDKIPDDMSLSLLIQLVQKANYTHPCISAGWYTKYVYNNTPLFNCLAPAKQKLF
jgi:hypothetical protein